MYCLPTCRNFCLLDLTNTCWNLTGLPFLREATFPILNSEFPEFNTIVLIFRKKFQLVALLLTA
jgi:hypothetical protein